MFGYIIAGLVALYFAPKGNFLSSFGGGSMPTYNSAPPQGTYVRPGGSSAGLEATGVNAVESGLGAAQKALQSAGSSLASSIPIIGAAFGAISSALIQASEQRRKQAISENQAVAAALPGWDQAITQIVNGYNNGLLTANQAAQLVDQQWALYWQEVGGVIQPGRNGCQSGAVEQPKGVSFCGGDYGAACCVGYDDLLNSGNNIKYALAQTDNTGKASPAYILPVFASKYGGVNRPGYTVTVQRKASFFSI